MRTNTQSSDTGTVITVKPSPSKKVGDKIRDWFGNLDKKAVPSSSSNGSKSKRRNSEGSKGSGSGFASKLRSSIRNKRASIGSGGRPRTTSVGSLPSKESTPIGDDITVTNIDNKAGTQYRRKLSFGQDDTDNEIEAEHASPGDLPGEMFLLDNIKEEPETQSRTVDTVRMMSVSTSSSGVSSQSAVVRSSDQEHQPPVSCVSAAINIDTTTSSSVMNNSDCSETVPHLEQIEVSFITKYLV